jgi:fermentation-respiration switch protein FrsA (DUF1100 family)
VAVVWVLVALALVGALVLVGNVAAGFMATRPRLQARLFGQNNTESLRPEDIGLPYERVDYAPGLWGWWIPATEGVATAVLVHGFGLSDEPIVCAPEPLLAFAASLRAHRINSLVVNLGYATGTHSFSGGRREARDIAQAARWATDRAGVPVVLWGFSAGGHDALIAATTEGVAGVAADSAYADTARVVRQQAARTVGLPEWLFAFTPWSFRLFGGRDVSVRRVWPRSNAVPALLIHGTNDEAIAPAQAEVLGAITGGEVWMVAGAGHVDAYRVATDEYVARAVAFITGA